MENDNREQNGYNYEPDNNQEVEQQPYEQQPYEQQPNGGQPYYGQQLNGGQPYYGQPYGGQQYYQQPVNQKKNALGITSMILGIISLVFSCCCMGFSIVLGVVAIILGIVSLNKKESTKGFAIAGIILGVVGLLSAIIFIVFEIYLRQSGLYDYYMQMFESGITDENINQWIK